MKSILSSLVFVLFLFGLSACSDDDSGTSSMEDVEFQCNVTGGYDWVQQEIISPNTGVSIAKVKKNDDGSQTAYFIEKLDKVSMRNFNKKCDSLERLSRRFDDGSFICKDSRVEFSITAPADEVGQAISEIKEDMEEECDYYEQKYGSNKNKSSSSKGSSSSIMSSSSSSSSSLSSSSLSSSSLSSSPLSSSSLSSSSLFDESVYTYQYKGRGLDNGSRWSISITSNCLDSECFEDFEDFDFGDSPVNTSTDGVDGGKALLLPGDGYVVLPWDMNQEINEGSLDFYFKPGIDFYDENIYALVGNDGARMNVVYWAGSLIFSKNLADTYISVAAEVSLNKDGWNHITAEWNAETGLIAIFLDGKQLVSKVTEFAYYSPSDRGRGDNVMMVGYKSECCLANLSREIFGNGAFDNIRVVTNNIFEITEMSSSSNEEESSSSVDENEDSSAE